MKDRIKKIRADNKLSMEKFGEQIGITRSSVCKLESGENSPSEQTIRLICKEFGISKDWLLTGIGEMLIEDCQEERFSVNIGKLQRTDNETIMRWVNAIAETKPEILVEIEKFMRKVLENQEEPD